MPPDDDDAAFIWDMLRYALIIVKLTADKKFEDVFTDDGLKLALERAIEIIGEAAKGVSEETELAHPHIPWKKIVQQRHVIAHEYGDINYSLLWRVAKDHIPRLIRDLEAILPEPPQLPDETTP